jgi:DHA2 family multidrug resistance protein-like MFS transporter
LGWIFVRRQLALDDPLIDLRLFGKPAFTASVATYGLTIFVLFGGFFYLPQYLQLVRGLSPLEAGLWSIPSSLAFVAGAMATPALGRKVRPAVAMAAGLAFSALGYIVITRIDTGTAFLTYMVGSVIFSLGVSPVFTLTNDVIIGSAPPERAGAAAGISETSAELGGALGIAVFGSIGVAVYRRLLSDDALSGVPGQVVEGARDTLGGAIALASELPPEAAAQLLDAARDAFLAGLRFCAIISMIGSLALALFVLARLGHVPRSKPSPEAGGAAPGSALPSES